MISIVVASNNKNKVKEIKNILKNRKVKVFSLEQAGFKGKIRESGETLTENALINIAETLDTIKAKTM